MSLSTTRTVLSLTLATLVFIAGFSITGFSQQSAVGTIVLSNDDWVLSDTAFAGLPVDTAALATNLANLLTGGPSGTIHAYSDFFAFTGAQLASTLSSAGYTYTTGTGISFDLATISSFDALLLGLPTLNPAELDVLEQYVNAGGSVYIHGGNGISDPNLIPNAWNPFLSKFGLGLEATGGFNGLDGVTSIASSHPLFNRVNSVYISGGHFLSGCCTAATTQPPSQFSLFAVFQCDPNCPVNCLEGTAEPLTTSATSVTSGVTALRAGASRSRGIGRATRLDPTVFRRLRDEVLSRTPDGRQLTALYNAHGFEVVRLLVTDSVLRSDLLEGLLLWQGAADGLVDGSVTTVPVTPEQARIVDVVTNRLSAVGSRGLRQAIQAQRRRVPPGFTLAQALLRDIGHPSHAPGRGRRP